MNNAAINTVPVLGRIYAFISLGYTPRSEIAGSYEKSMSNTFRNCEAIFQSGCTISHSHQKYMKIPISPYPHQNLLFSITVVVVAIVRDMKWYLFAILIYISLRNGEVEHLFMSLLIMNYYSWYRNPQCDGEYTHWNSLVLELRNSQGLSKNEIYPPQMTLAPAFTLRHSRDPSIIEAHMK